MRATLLTLALVAAGCAVPPEGMRPPPSADAAPFDGVITPDVSGPVDAAAVFEVALSEPDPPPPVDPGRVTLHRLNRAEYNNTVRDLFGTARRPADDFPADDRGYGFDNVADVLTMSAVQLELYQRAAERLVDEAMFNPVVPSTRRQFEAEALTGSVGAASSTAWNLWSNGELPVRYTPAGAGRYRVTVRAWQTAAGPDPAHMDVTVDGVAAGSFNVTNLAASPGEFSVEVTLRAGVQVTIAAEFTNDFYVMATGEDRNLLVDWIRVEGPVGAAPAPNPQRERILVCTPAAGMEADCARTVLSRFARRAWRRPVTDAEVTRLLGFLDVARTQGEGFEEGLKLALQAVVLSPHFLFRVELDPDPTSLAVHPLNDHELAARLSYFLWSSMPDDALFALADAGRLRDPATLRAQVERMLADPKARAFVDNFAGQWLFTRAVPEHDADPARFPGFTAAVKTSLRAETEAYFEHFLRDDVGMGEFLTADYSFLDDTVARYYGVTAPAGTGLRRTTLPPTRRGVLSQGSLLAVTSHPDRTSPVRRGQWVLNQLLCAPPPPPPPNVEGLPVEAMPTGTLRQRMERHRTQPSCASCHALMDPIGFAFEGFDAVGVARTTDSGFPVDTTGTLPGTGEPFTDNASLAALLQRDPRFPRCVTQQVFTYALGRGPANYDQPVIDQITSEWSGAGMRLRDLVVRVVTSESFTSRRGEPAGGM
ncbi:MAG: DUF1592 domain-containing protein [Polyangiales bacterium]